jgi:CubicO group peptidase (beta-lactamase class C family)
MYGDRRCGAGDGGVILADLSATDADIQALLTQRIEAERDGVGLVVGVVDSAGGRVVAHGTAGQADDRLLDGDTVFEIGSSTKVFTALLLADMVERGEVSLDDPASKFLPSGVTMPEHRGRPITLADLALHRSGLPRDADNYDATDAANPFAQFTVDRLYAFLGRGALARDVGASHLYSNVGMGLLGHVLSLRAGVDFKTLVRERIAAPLGMSSTGIALPPAQQTRLARGHDGEGQPTVYLDVPAIPGAGALRSTANDLLTFLAAELGIVETPLKAAMSAQLAQRWQTGRSDFDLQAHGWCVSTDADGEVVWHVGRTSGFRCFLGFDASNGVGVVVLGNMATTRAGEDVGFHLLRGRPLTPAPARRSVVRVDPEALTALAGHYRLSDAIEIEVTPVGERLRFVGAGQRMLFYPLSPTEFFLKHFDVLVAFEFGGDGQANAFVLRQDGQDRRAPRIG